MIRSTRCSLALGALLLLSATIASTARAAEPVDWQAFRWDEEVREGREVRDGMLVPGRLVVRFAPGAVPAEVRAKAGGGIVTGQLDLDRAVAAIGAQRFERVFAPAPLAKAPVVDEARERFYVVHFDPERATLRTAAAELGRVPGVESVEPDPVHHFSGVLPNDPSLDLQWWLRSLAYGGGDVRVLEAWNNTTGSSDVVVCAADSGTDWQHPDLGGTGPDYTDGVIWINQAEYNGTPGVDDDGNGKIDDVRGWDFIDGVTGAQSPPQDVSTPDNDPMDYEGHGTAVAGCMAAITDNGIGVAGINWSAKVMVCRVGWLPPGSSIGVVSMLFAAQALDYARINGADVFNASWGSSNFSPLVTAATNATGAGMIIVTAAGNDDSQTASYLASRGDVVAVAATNQGDGKADFSNYGTWVDISAPGTAIYTTAYNRTGSNGTEHAYGAPSGTSFASPIVAGGFALAKAAYPGDNRQELTARVLAAVDDIYPKNIGFTNQLGSGRLNLTKLFPTEPKWRVPAQLPTMIDAMNVCAPGDTIAVASSAILTTRIALPTDKAMYVLGGWDDTYTTRDLVNGLTPIAPVTGTGSTVVITAGAGPDLVFDGFSISGGRAPLVSFEPIEGSYGGGVRVRDASPTLRNLRIEGNIAGLSGEYGAGGGIAVLGGSPTFENVVVTNNSARRGAGIYVHRGAPTFRNVRVHDNVSYDVLAAEGPLGGAVYLVSAPDANEQLAGGTEVLFEDVLIENHSVNGPGGGLYASDSIVRAVRTTVSDNTSRGKGAGMYVSGGSLTFDDVALLRNQIAVGVNESGGGLFATSAEVAISGTRFEDNVSGFGGGGASFDALLSLDLGSSVFVGNAAGFFGSGMFGQNLPAAAQLVGNTIAYNAGASAGGNGIYFTGGSVMLDRNLVAFNGSGGGSLADGIMLSGIGATTTCNLVHGNATGNWGGIADPTGTDGNLADDPAFCPEAGSIALTPASPAATAACGPIGAGAVGCTTVGIDDLPGTPPVVGRRLELRQNAPNPFNPSTTIEFSLPNPEAIALRVLDLRGRVVRVLAEGEFPAGVHRVVWDGRDPGGRSVSSGTYLYELRTENRVLVRKMGLLK